MAKTIVITGASAGFGKITSQTLAAAGYQVVATMRDISSKNKAKADDLLSWAQRNKFTLDVVELDVTSDRSVTDAAAFIRSRYGAAYAVINNAGIYGGGFTESYTTEDFRKMYEVNVFGSVRVVHAFLPQMREAGNGLFIQVSSIMGRFVIPYSSVYTSSKWAVEAIAESLRYELAPLGIDSVIIQPGAFQTDIFQNSIEGSNKMVNGEYGKSSVLQSRFAGNFVEMMSQENLPNKPQDVADAIRTIIELPAGQRPLRVVVDKMMNGLAEPLNETQEKVQQGFLASVGLTELLQPAGTVPA